MAKKNKAAKPATPAQSGAKPADRMYKNRVALADSVKKKTCGILNNQLASALDMYSQAKFAHWNVKGMNFYQLHLVFDDTAKVVFKQIDPIAERITQLGGVANGTVAHSAVGTSIPAYNVNAVSGPEHLLSLADSLGKYCAELRKASDDIDDAGDEPTSDFIKQLVVDAEEELYFLESHMEAGDVQ
jgi:starvation-inducible DNA-binding protein